MRCRWLAHVRGDPGRLEVRRATTALVVVSACLFSPLSGLIPSNTARAADLAQVGGWATLGSISPSVGCWLDASVEVRREGFALPNVDVGVDLVHDGQIVSSDAGTTDGDGIAYLGVDTNWAESGLEAWLDVTVGGEYAGGMPLSITDGGGCADNPNVVEIGAEVPVADSGDTIAEGSAEPQPGTDAVSFYVPTYVQQRNLSCEYASLVIAMGAFGVWVSEYDFDSLVGWSENPYWGYRGDITGWWGNTDDYGVYPEALVPALAHYGFWGDVFYGQGDASQLKAYLDAETPVLVWVGLWGDTSFYDYASDGTPFELAAGQHVVVAYGYDSGGVYVSDPAYGTKHYIDWGTFMYYWNVLDGMSLAVGPS
jgi:uncharacterized protein YvpB